MEKSYNEIFNEVAGVLSEYLSIDQDDISRSSHLEDDLKADSLDKVEFIMELEDKYEITIPDDDYEKLQTVDDVVNYLQECGL